MERITPKTRSVSGRGSQSLSIVTPAFRESENLHLLHERICDAMNSISMEWEWIIIDDHSPDDTFSNAAKLVEDDDRLSCYRLSRNCGFHVAMTCGLEKATGDCAVVMASDLQDPPEVIVELIKKWNEDAQIVWAVRNRRDGASGPTKLFSRLYYLIMRKFVGIRNMPATGADFFLLDRTVIEAFLRCDERNTSSLALLSWLGFRQAFISYNKEGRGHGVSGWTVSKKIKLVLDSVLAFSYRPIRIMSVLGLAVALMGFAYAAYIVINATTGAPIEGWSSLMVIVLVLGGLQMLMLGVLGEYVWRGTEEARQRPRYLIEAVARPEGKG